MQGLKWRMAWIGNLLLPHRRSTRIGLPKGLWDPVVTRKFRPAVVALCYMRFQNVMPYYRISNHCIANTRISSGVFRGQAFKAVAPLRGPYIMYRILLKGRHEM